VLYDTLWWDRIEAGAGDDVIVAAKEFWVSNGPESTGTDVFNGGAGNDTITYALTGRTTNGQDGNGVPFGFHAGVNVNLETGLAYRIYGGDVLVQPDSLISIENVDGSMYDDVIVGDAGANVLNGLSGNDRIWGRGGNDTIRGGEGDDQLWGEGGNDLLEGGAGNDLLDGGTGNDTLKGGDGNDSLKGGSGDDTLEGGAGNDTLDGGSGIDTAVFATSGAVQVNLGLGIAAGALGNDILVSIENVITGSGADTVFGNAAANRIETGSGNDYVSGGGGNDQIHGGAGDDTLHGDDGNDQVFGGSGKDMITGGAGNDYLAGEDGNDVINGGAGNDSVLGGNGNDVLRGGAGDDTINGGAGADVIRWDQGDLGLDTVLGFVIGQDKLAFGQGFLAAGGDWQDNLLVFNNNGSAMLAANTAEAGWQFIANFVGVTAIALETAIDQGTVFGLPAGVGGGGPGDLFF
jgi:Ca2+-binding RTX toxin-like protein